MTRAYHYDVFILSRNRLLRSTTPIKQQQILDSKGNETRQRAGNSHISDDRLNRIPQDTGMLHTLHLFSSLSRRCITQSKPTLINLPSFVPYCFSWSFLLFVGKDDSVVDASTVSYETIGISICICHKHNSVLSH